MTPYLVGIDNHKGPAETNPFESSFAPEGAGAALCDPSSQAPKRNLSPGADQSTEKPVNKQIKRPQLQDLNRYDSSMTQPSSFGFHSSSSITRGQSFESDSPPSGSDMGYKAGESDSDPAAASSASADSRPHAQRPALEHQVSSFDLGGEGVSSRSFQSMLQDYASNARFVQGMPKAMDLPPHLTQQQLVNQSPLTLPPGAVNDEAKSTQPSPVTSHDAQEALKQSQAPTTRSSNASQPAAKKQLPPRHTKRNSQTAAKPQESAPQSKPTSATASKPSKQAEQEHEKLDPDEMKRRQFLERNRIAACKSRQKKKEWVKQLES